MGLKGHHYYTDQTFEDIKQVEGEIRDSEFINCIFVRCSFSGAVFQKCRFLNCEFRNCDLSLIRAPETSFAGTCFRDLKLIGVDWTLANLDREVLGEPLQFDNSVVSHSTFIGLSLEGIKFTNCIVHNVDFREADLSKSDFTDTDLHESMFLMTNLTQANLEAARNYQIPPDQNTLTKAKFSFPEVLSLLYSMDILLEDRDRLDDVES